MRQSPKTTGLFAGAFAWSLAALACGGGAAPAASPSGSEAAPAGTAPAAGGAAPQSAAKDDAATSDTPKSDAPPKPSAESAPPKPAAPSLVALCEKGCDKMKARCSASSVENCRMNCAQYEHPPAGCEEEARAALECSNAAEDTTCVNIAPEICAPKFRRVVACANGTTVTTKEESERTPPAHWERFKAAGFSSVMPKGVSAGSEEGHPAYSVKEGPLTYSVRILPAPKERPTQKNMVMVAMGVLGKCSQKLKLYGMVDRPEKVFLRFDSHCPDGTDWRGAFAIVGSKMYMPFVSLPKGTKLETAKNDIDAFIYGFDLDK